MIRIRDGQELLDELGKRASATACDEITSSVRTIIDDVRRRGDAALKELAQRFGDDVRDDLRLSDDEIAAAAKRVTYERRKLIERAAENIRVFANAVMDSIAPIQLDRDGWSAGLNYRPVASACCYVPSGRFPLPSTALMTAITAQSAGVKRICIASPHMCDEVIFAGTLAGVSEFYAVGGAQAIAAFALGMESIAPVDMIVGPGNAYVTEAKRQLIGTVGIDMLAGPSEVAIIVDSGAPCRRVVLDMLAQAEHDPLAKSYLLTDSPAIAMSVAEELVAEGRKAYGASFDESLGQFCFATFETLAGCAHAANLLAPEHLQIMVATPDELAPTLTSYGALFMGYDAAVPFGDYLAGPNHTLPTGTTARFAEGLNPRTFLRAQSWMKPTGSIAKLANSAADFADMEGLSFHAAAARARIS